MSDIEFWRDDEEPHETVEIRYLDNELASNGLREIDEIVYRDLHLETLDHDHAYIRVAGMMFSVWAVKAQGGALLSITCEPDGATQIEQETDPCATH